MGYFAAYWGQIKGFYRQIYIQLFAKNRELDGDLNYFVMKPGFFWEMAQMHWLLVRMVGRFILGVFQLVFGYLMMTLICIMLIAAPLLILLFFPVFTFNRRKRLKNEGRAL